MEDFDLKSYLKNNVLLNEGLELKASEIEDKKDEKEKVDEMSHSKMSKKALKEKIKAEIISTLAEDNIEEESQYDASLYSEADEDEAEDVDVDVDDEAGEADVDVDVDVDADVETGEPEFADEPGLSSEELEIQNSLKTAYDNAVSIGDEKLANQIANTITFFTRAHVVPRND